MLATCISPSRSRLPPPLPASVEGLLSAFPKLIASELAGAGASASAKQHTFVETDNVRYVYLPLEGSLFLLLVTNKVRVSGRRGSS